MKGWNGRILRINLSRGKFSTQEFDATFATNFLGGRGFAAKILWDETKPGIDAFSPENLLIMATGPLTGLPLPSSGKIVVAAKSPLTGGYGDGNLGSLAAVNLRKAGYDALVFTGAASKPSYVNITDDEVEIQDAADYWRLGSFETERKLREKHGKTVGILTIGPAGENLVRYATVVSQEGRSGGRPGIGAVMGSKRLKAVVVEGRKEVPLADKKKLEEIGAEGYKAVLSKPNYGFWKRQGTMSTVEWSQANSVLPTFNFRECVFEEASGIGGELMETLKVAQRGCPQCNMTCGNVIEDAEGEQSELDYENVVMLGSNIGIGNLKKVASLNRMADDYGLDTISLGNTIGFAMEASERKLLDEKLEWGNFDHAKQLVEDIVHARGVGRLLARGTRAAAEEIGHGSAKWAMNVKGLEISAYNCHSAPGMALAYGTCAIGAHHKDAWVISWEMNFGRESYGPEKVAKVIEFQRIRGGAFESLVTCRFPWIELGFELEWYTRFFDASTGVKMSIEEFFTTGDRIYSLIRAFWIREYGSKWSRSMDYPPARWFEEPPQKGSQKGVKLDFQKYGQLLDEYYKSRGWNRNGVPEASTLRKLGLEDVARTLQNIAPSQ
jgi:aldehyde:ferredoxin oxidoreductase